jgi:GNAT superfamily N-acetyltransferase
MNKILKMPPGRVRAACDRDIEIISGWLPKDASVDSLAVNWNITKRVYLERGMLVWEDASTSEPVAYFWGSLNSTSSILEVRPSRRGEGIGQAFVDYLLEQSRANGEALLEIECAPPSSEQFWRLVGFEIDDEDRRLIGRRILKLPQPLPDGPQVEVKVSFFHEAATYDRERKTAPLSEHVLTGVQGAGKVIILSEKVAHFDLPGGKDLAVRLEVDGREVYFNKAKYSEGAARGIMRCENGFSVGAVKVTS